MRVSVSRRLTILAASAAAALFSCKQSAPPSHDLSKINHVIVLYLENHSFDNLYGEFPGANGLSSPGALIAQVQADGTPYHYLPQPPGRDTVFPPDLPNRPFAIDPYVANNVKTPDLVHKYYQEQAQIDGGKMDRFALVSNAKGLSVGYYHTSALPLAEEAKKYVLCDNFYHSAFGGSFLNHIWMIAAATPVWPNAPAGYVAQLDSAGRMVKDGIVTQDGYAVNTCYSVNAPHPPWGPRGEDSLLPNQTLPTIGDRLDSAGISWAWYSGGWNSAFGTNADSLKLFQYHHQAFTYFKNFADGTENKAKHLKDEEEFIAAARSGTLPAVAFVKPYGIDNEHPGYADVMTGEKHTEELIDAIRNGPDWKDCVIIITYDEHGGFWDHVAPPKIDRWGPGSRVPAIIISPFAKTGYVDHTQYETVSILSLIEHRWNLPPLSARDAGAADLAGALNL